MHCYEGEILEVIPWSESRPNYANFRMCRHPVAMVKWDPEFNMINSPVPLNMDLYAKEDAHLGWNLVSDEFAAYICERMAECAEAEAAKQNPNPK